MQNTDYSELEKKIGYEYKDVSLLKTALTHSSYSNALKLKKINIECNERLEFLGDSVLSLTAAEFLYKKYPDLPEGELTKKRAAIVCREALSSYAKEINLGDYLFIDKGEEKNNARERKSLLENTFEALLASIYLDIGKEEALIVIRKFLIPFFEKELFAFEKGDMGLDYKTELQQMIQQSGVDSLEYKTVGESGPDHQKVFEVIAMMNSNIIGRGKGSTKREAEQNAAKEALALFGEI